MAEYYATVFCCLYILHSSHVELALLFPAVIDTVNLGWIIWGGGGGVHAPYHDWCYCLGSFTPDTQALQITL